MAWAHSLEDHSVSRTPVSIRMACPDDAAELVAVSARSGGELGRAPTAEPTGDARLSEASGSIARIAADPEQQLLVAEIDRRVVGAVHLRRGPISPLQQAEIVQVSHLYVLPEVRRRGIASLLLSTATSWAEEKDSSHLIAVSPAQSRDAQRFLARLGFGQVAVVRAAEVPGLRARFCGSIGIGGKSRRLIAARRSLGRARG